MDPGFCFLILSSFCERLFFKPWVSAFLLPARFLILIGLISLGFLLLAVSTWMSIILLSFSFSRSASGIKLMSGILASDFGATIVLMLLSMLVIPSILSVSLAILVVWSGDESGFLVSVSGAEVNESSLVWKMLSFLEIDSSSISCYCFIFMRSLIESLKS